MFDRPKEGSRRFFSTLFCAVLISACSELHTGRKVKDRQRLSTGLARLGLYKEGFEKSRMQGVMYVKSLSNDTPYGTIS